MRRLIAAILLFGGLSSPSFATESATLRSVLQAIENANAQAYVYLTKGRYSSTANGTDVTIDVPVEPFPSQLKLDVEHRAVASASWEFNVPIVATIRAGGHCVRLSIKKLSYGPAGVINGGSDTTITPLRPLGHPHAVPACDDSEALPGLSDIFNLDPDASQIFKGSIFHAFAATRKCANETCSTKLDGKPISKVIFFGDPGGGHPSPFHVELHSGSVILLPSGYLTLGEEHNAATNGTDGGIADFASIEYDLNSDSGDAVLNAVNLPLADGDIEAANTKLIIRKDSNLQVSNFRIHRDGAEVKIVDGDLSGSLGENTRIVLASNSQHTSTLVFSDSTMALHGISYIADSTGSALSILRGKVVPSLQSADLWLSDSTRLVLRQTGFTMTLGCPDATPMGSCIPVSWSPKGVVVQGDISGLAASLTGGSFAISTAGTQHPVAISAGEVYADTLHIDSTQASTPITGAISKFRILVEGQNLPIDQSTNIGAASLELASQDLTLKSGQILPVGHLTAKGTVRSVEGGLLGKIGVTANGETELSIERLDNDEPNVTDGYVKGRVSVGLEGSNHADGTLDVEKIRYYRGVGSGKLNLAINSASFKYDTPEAHASQGGLVSADVTVNSLPVTFELREPLEIGPLDLNANHANWSIQPIANMPLKLNFQIPPQEFVYVAAHPIVGTCTVKVMSNGQTTNLDARVSMFASSADMHVHVGDVSPADGLETHVDDNCKEAADALCALTGGALGGPFGAIALAVVCNRKLDDAEHDVVDKIRGVSREKVEGFRYDFDN